MADNINQTDNTQVDDMITPKVKKTEEKFCRTIQKALDRHRMILVAILIVFLVLAKIIGVL